MQKTRYSKQRELIYQNLKNRCDHPTAEAIYSDLKQEHAGLSLGTVYRNLNFLADAKLIQKLDVGHQMVHFDADMHPHYHFICDNCHHVFDIEADISDIVSNEIQPTTKHQIQSVNITFTGVCMHCRDKENN